MDALDRREESYRSALLRQIERLAEGRVNDAVKLAFLDGEQMAEIDGLDLSALTEFKRNGNGTVEIRLADRLAALERLLTLLKAGAHDPAQQFFQALESGAAAEP